MSGMTQIKLTKAAFTALHGHEYVVITDEVLHSRVAALAGETFTVLVANHEGCIGQPGEELSDAHLGVFGMPLGLRAMILQESNKAVIAEWGGERLQAKTRREFGIFLASEDDAELDGRLSAFFNQLQNQIIVEMAARAARLETQVTYLRQTSERMMMALTMSERVLKAAGYSDLALIASLSESAKCVGPQGDIDTAEFQQILPTDGLGLRAIEFHMVVPTKNLASGYLEVALLRDFDGKLLAFSSVRYAELIPGWNIFRFGQMVSDTFGDARLMLRWHTKGDGAAPMVSLAKAYGNRFGRTEDDSSLALKAYTGACEPDLSDEALQMVGGEPVVGLIVLPGYQPEHVEFYGGKQRYAAARAEQTFDPFVIDGDTGEVRAHLASDRVTGITYRTKLPKNVRALELTLELPEEAGPGMVLYAALASRLDGIEAVMTRLIEGRAAETDLICCGMAEMDAGATTTIELQAEHYPEEVYVVVVAKGRDEHITNGWCSLKRLVLNAPARQPAQDHPDSSVSRKVVRAIVLPELGNLVQFLHGAEELERLSVEGGFLPMLLEENGGFLQTHPLRDKVSGAILPQLVMPGTCGVVATATTGHPHAPEFIYLVVLVRHGTPDLIDAVEAVAKAAGENGPFNTTFEEDDGAVYWRASRLQAGEEHQLKLDFDRPLADVYNIVLAALPIDGHTSFGWCRWTALGIISQETKSEA